MIGRPAAIVITALVITLSFVAACSGPERVDEPIVGATADATAEGPAGAPAVDPIPAEDLADVPGLIAAAGPGGLRLLHATGEVEAEITTDRVVTQPTWSRDGTRLVATALDPTSGVIEILLVDPATGGSTFTPARRGTYFFYSWSPDGELIAALGPGPRGTSLDVLDRDGAVVSTTPVDGGSVFIAWEPGGSDLLVHRDTDLLLIPGGRDTASQVDLGRLGSDFQAPSWIPGTRQALVVSTDPSGPRLMRVDIDTLELDDLGAVGGMTAVSVHPSGDRAVIAHVGTPGDGSTVQTAFDGRPSPVQAAVAAVEIVDLVSGERRLISDETAIWMEWSPDGSRLLLATLGPGSGRWRIWDGEELSTIDDFTPSAVFLQSYILFSDQYVETPRLWSPDGSAIVHGATTDAGTGVVVHRSGTESPAAIIAADPIAFWSPVTPG